VFPTSPLATPVGQWQSALLAIFAAATAAAVATVATTHFQPFVIALLAAVTFWKTWIELKERLQACGQPPPPEAVVPETHDHTVRNHAETSEGPVTLNQGDLDPSQEQIEASPESLLANAAQEPVESSPSLPRPGDAITPSDGDGDRINVVLERGDGEDWGFAWQVGAHKVQRLIVACISVPSPAGLWNTAQQVQGLSVMHFGDELMSVNGLTGFAAIETTLDSATVASLQFLRAHAVQPVPSVLSALARRRGQKQSVERQIADTHKSVDFDEATQSQYIPVVRNTFIEVRLPPSETQEPDGKFARSDPTPFMRMRQACSSDSLEQSSDVELCGTLDGDQQTVSHESRASQSSQEQESALLACDLDPATYEDSLYLPFSLDAAVEASASYLGAASSDAMQHETGHSLESIGYGSQWVQQGTQALAWGRSCEVSARHGFLGMVPESTGMEMWPDYSAPSSDLTLQIGGDAEYVHSSSFFEQWHDFSHVHSDQDMLEGRVMSRSGELAAQLKALRFATAEPAASLGSESELGHATWMNPEIVSADIKAHTYLQTQDFSGGCLTDTACLQ
jgi:hypothetical protein